MLSLREALADLHSQRSFPVVDIQALPSRRWFQVFISKERVTGRKSSGECYRDWL